MSSYSNTEISLAMSTLAVWFRVVMSRDVRTRVFSRPVMVAQMHSNNNNNNNNMSACQLFANLGRKISSASGDDREGAFLFQRVSVLVQRYNAVLLHDTLPAPDCTD